MATWLKGGKGPTGKLKMPKQRIRQLKQCARLTLREAGAKMGIGRERVRHLYRVYGIKRRGRAEA